MTQTALHVSITHKYTIIYDDIHIGMRLAYYISNLIFYESKETM